MQTTEPMRITFEPRYYELLPIKDGKEKRRDRRAKQRKHNKKK
jgi:hypothetical protein